MSLLKMVILSFKSFSVGDLTMPSVFNVMFNPASYKVETNLTKDTATTNGSVAQTSPLTAIALRKMSFDFMVDGTGANGDKREVLLEIKKFENVVMPPKASLAADILGKKETKLPKLILLWGTFAFSCEIENYAVNYTLFSSLGIPVRATISATFSEIVQNSPTDLLDRFVPPAQINLVNNINGYLNTAFAATGSVVRALEIAKEENLSSIRSKIKL